MARQLHDASGDWDWAAMRELCLREAARVLGHGAAADDAAQEAMCRAWRYRARIRREAASGWLATVARREALRIAGRAPEAELFEHHVEPSASHEEQSALRVDVARGLETLADHDRRLLAARYWLDLTQAEAARSLDLAEGTVKVRLHRVRGRLRDLLIEECSRP